MEKINLLQKVFDGVTNIKTSHRLNEIINKEVKELPVDVKKNHKKKLSTFYKKFYYFYLISMYDYPKSLNEQVYMQKDTVTPQYIRYMFFNCLRSDYNLHKGKLKLFRKGNNLYIQQVFDDMQGVEDALRFSKAREKELA